MGEPASITNLGKSPSKRPRIRWWGWLLRAGALVGLLLAGIVLFLQSAVFQQMVRERLVAALEQSTGTSAELREFSVDWPRLEVSLGGLVLHGLEPAEAPPLFSAEWITLRFRLISFWGLRADLQQVRILEPKLNIVIGADGSSNLPPMPHTTAPDGQWAERLLALRIDQLEVLRGEFGWNERRLPLDFQASRLQLVLDYQRADESYAGRLDFHDILLSASSSPPLASRGQLQFRLYSDRAEIASFHWQSPKSHVELKGTVNNFSSPRFQFRYDLLVDQAEAAPLLHSRGWIGDVAWKGEGSLAAGTWQLQGDLVARTRRNGIAGWSNVPWTARGDLQVASANEASERKESGSWQASLTDLKVQTLGGQLIGSAVVRNSAQGPATTLNFKAQRLSFPAITQAMAALPVRLASLEWAGAVSGPLRAQFMGMGQALKVQTDWTIEPAPVVPPGFTPISGKLRGSYDAVRRRVESNGSYIDLPATQLSGEGWFDDRESQMQLSISTSNLDEIRNLAALLGQDLAALPVRLMGTASAAVEWTGGSEHPRLAGDFQLTEFTYQEIPWDRFSGQVDYQRGLTPQQSAASLAGPASVSHSEAAVLKIGSGELIQGEAAIDFDLQLDMQDGGLHPDTPFHIRGQIRNGSVKELQKLAGRDYPIEGILQGSFDVSGTRQEPVGDGTVTLTGGRYREESFDRLTAKIQLEKDGTWTVDSIRVTKGGGTVAGNLRFNSRTEEFRFDFTAAKIELASIQSLQGSRFRTAGIVQGTLAGEGSLQSPELRGQIQLRQFGFGLAEPGTVSMTVESRLGQAYWTMAGKLWNGQVHVQGQTVLQNLFPSVAEVSFEDVDLPPLVRAFRQPPTGLQGHLTGILHAQLNAKDLSALTLRGELSSLEGSFDQVGVRSRGAVQFQYQNQILRLERLSLEGPRAELETSGTVLIAADPVLNLNAKGQMDLTTLGQLNEEFYPSGGVRLDAQIGGTVRHPQWRGRLRISDGSFHYGTLPNGVDRINGTVVFEGNRGVLENVIGESGSGQVQFSGFVRYGEDSEWQFNLGAEASGVRIRYPEGLSTWINGRVNWSGTIQDSVLEGRVLLTRQSVSPRFDLVQVLLQHREETSSAAVPDILRDMRLNLEVSSAADLRLDTQTARNLQTDVDLRIQGTAAQPAWLGRIGILEGEILFAGKRYSINRGEISFVNPFRFEPVLSLSVQARVQRYDIAMDFSGPPDRLTVTYRSDPPLPTSDILALLVAGSARETSLETSTNQPLPQVGADALLSQALQSQIGSRLDRLFGSGRVRVDPQISGLGRSTNASIALEQQLSDNLSVLYITDVSSTQQQTIQAEWDISPKLSVVGIRDQNGLIGVNFQITLRFR